MGETRSYRSEDGWQHIHPDVKWDYMRMESLRGALFELVRGYLAQVPSTEMSKEDWLDYQQIVLEARWILTTAIDSLTEQMVDAFLVLQKAEADDEV